MQRVPFDIAEAETEIMEGPLMEYSGPKLALFKYAQMARLVVHSGLFVALFVPWGSASALPAGLAPVLGQGARAGAAGDGGGGHARPLPDRPGRPILRRACWRWPSPRWRWRVTDIDGIEAMSLLSKCKEAMIGLKAGRVTLPYPAEPRPVAANFRGRPIFDAAKCIGCAGCANNCPAREILVFDVCQEVRILQYLGRRCTYCGRCADVCPEKAITMSREFETATEPDRRPPAAPRICS